MSFRTRAASIAAALALTFGIAANAQEGESQETDHAAMDHGEMAMEMSDDPVIAAWQQINADMHADMSIEFTGDPDVDFIRGMIPHHQGAVRMAEVLLEHGSDPETRALAEAIIAAQEEEIAFMRAWLAERGY